MKLRHIISTEQFLDNPEFLNELFKSADELRKMEEGKIPSSLNGKILVSLFYEPSTRTRLSFESAMLKLGGRVIGTEAASEFSSVAKGESLLDTIRVVNSYADVIVLRHKEEGSAKIASEVSSVPIINAGDGPGEHPTQALLDLYTIKRELGRVNDIEIAFVGDLLHGRTVHSLLTLLTLSKNIRVYLVSPPQLKLSNIHKDALSAKGLNFQERTDLWDILGKVDILYVTRVQRERFPSIEEYEEVKGSYIIDSRVMEQLKEDGRVMHPLPRVNEITPEVDKDKRAAYFRQAENGLYIRMALLVYLLTKN